jgi:hypothetical protein
MAAVEPAAQTIIAKAIYIVTTASVAIPSVKLKPTVFVQL